MTDTYRQWTQARVEETLDIPVDYFEKGWNEWEVNRLIRVKRTSSGP